MPKEVVVVGAGIGGLSAAIHARLLGHDVLLLEAQAQVGGKAGSLEQEGFRLDPGPSIVILTRLYRQLFGIAGRRLEDYLVFERLDPITRVFSPWHEPIDLPSSSEACVELVREFSRSDADHLEHLLDQLDRARSHIDRTIFRRPFDRAWQLANWRLVASVRGFDVRKTYREIVDGLFSSPLLRAFFYGFPSYGGQTYHAKSFGGLMIPYLMLREGVWWPRGGVGAIPEALLKLALEIGVEARLNSPVDGLNTRGIRVESVRLDSESIRCDAVISNRDRYSVASWLGRDHSRTRASMSYFTVHWGIQGRLDSLSHHNLFIPEDFEGSFRSLYDDNRWHDEPIVYVNETSKLDPAVAPPGCSNAFAVVTSPSMDSEEDWDAVEPKVNAVRRTLSLYGVDFDEADIRFAKVQTPQTFCERDGSYRGSLYGCHESDRLFGMFPASNRDSEYRNLFYCGGSVQPGAGLPMALLSGKFAAELL